MKSKPKPRPRGVKALSRAEVRRRAIALLLDGEEPSRVALVLGVKATTLEEWFNALPLEELATHLKPILQRAVFNSLESFEKTSGDEAQGSLARYHRENAAAAWKLLGELDATAPKEQGEIASTVPIKAS